MGKLLLLDELILELKILRKSGKRIVFTNGCFDILHAGHSRYLSAARAEGDLLIIGLNSDQSVQQIKGALRPIIEEQQRAEVLAGLGCVDYVVLFDEPDPLKLICAIEPDVLVKGADWTEKDIIGGDFVKNRGGAVKRIRLLPDISTTVIIKRIRERFCKGGESNNDS